MIITKKKTLSAIALEKGAKFISEHGSVKMFEFQDVKLAICDRCGGGFVKLIVNEQVGKVYYRADAYNYLNNA